MAYAAALIATKAISDPLCLFVMFAATVRLER